MNTPRNYTNTLVNLDTVPIVMLCVSLVLLSTLVLEGYFAPILLYTLMITMGIILITLFSNKYEIFFKIKLFVFFFSLYLIYTLVNCYILLSTNPNILPYNYVDEITFYHYSNIGLPYISGEENFLEMFSNWKLPFYDVSLHVVFSSLITYFSILIDGDNNIMAQKLLSPFLGGMLLVVLYSTLRYQFSDRAFAVKATLAYGLLSAIFIYSTPLLRDTDIALAYMIFFFLFLQKNSFINFILLFMVAFTTIYLRAESGLILFGLSLLYGYLYAGKLQSRSIKFIFYILLMILFSFVLYSQAHKIIGMMMGTNERYLTRIVAASSEGSIASLFRKLPFPLSDIAKVLFGQMSPFPFFYSINNPPAAISGIFWPFIFIMMLYAVMKKHIRTLIDTKVKYLLIAAVTILFLMSVEPMPRRMMSVYPIIYITSLYVFFVIPKNKINLFLTYYISGIVSLNIFYYLLKL